MNLIFFTCCNYITFLFCLVSCSPGRESIDGVCTPCPVGFYKNRTGAISCDTCPLGFRTSGEGTIDAQDCNIGKVFFFLLKGILYRHSLSVTPDPIICPSSAPRLSLSLSVCLSVLLLKPISR